MESMLEDEVDAKVQLSATFIVLQCLSSIFHLVKIILGAVFVGKFHHYDHFTGFAPKGFAIAGLLLGLFGFVGRIVALLAVRRRLNIKKVLKLVLVAWCVVKMAELGLGIAGCGLRDDMEETIDYKVREEMMVYTGNENETESDIDHLQRAFKCCGATGRVPWRYTPWGNSHGHDYPDSCCLQYADGCGAVNGTVFQEQGCGQALAAVATHDITVFSVVLLTFTTLEMFVSTVLMVRARLCHAGVEFDEED